MITLAFSFSSMTNCVVSLITVSTIPLNDDECHRKIIFTCLDETIGLTAVIGFTRLLEGFVGEFDALEQ